MIRWNVLTWVKNAIGAIHYCPSERVHAQWANKLLLGLLPSRPHSSSNVVRRLFLSFSYLLLDGFPNKRSLLCLPTFMVKDQLLGYIGRDTTLEPPPLSTTVSVWQSAANCFNLHSKWVDVCCCGVCTWDCDARVSLHLQPLPISTMLQSAKKSCLHITVCGLRKDKIHYAKVEVKMKDVFEWKTSSTLSYSKQANRQRLLSNPKRKKKRGKPSFVSSHHHGASQKLLLFSF